MNADDDMNAEEDSNPAQLQPNSEQVAAESSAPDDVRAKMREALDRKHAAEHSGEDHLQGADKAHDVHGKAGGQRQFRRKSGG